MTASPPFALDMGGWLPGGDRAAREEAARAALAELRRDHARGEVPFLSAVEDPLALDALRETAGRIRGRSRRAVVFGTGGSSLGGRALVALAPGGGGSRPVRFFDSIDPASTERLLSRLDPSEASAIVVSKSGGTAETVAQAALALEWCGRASAPVRERVVVVVQPGESPLRTLAEAHGIEAVDHDPGIGGRFSVLSAAGLLPALVAGADAGAALDGARAVLSSALEGEGLAPPAAGAAAAVGLMEGKGVRTLVTAAYADALHPLAMWHRQLWAESLGKDGRGSTPAVARGTADQHSQLQLYLDGPPDKMFTLLVGEGGAGPRIPDGVAGIPPWLSGRTLGEVLSAHAQATGGALSAAGRPVRTFTLPVPDMRGAGGLMMHLMVETVLAGRLLGVDPYGQPAVEAVKRRAQSLLEGA